MARSWSPVTAGPSSVREGPSRVPTTMLAYLNRWRMLLAQRALRDGDVRLGSLASELGYASESAFSTAFKREVGESPLRYRYRVRDGLPAPAVGH